MVSLHCPLTPDTHHLIDARSIARMKPGAMLVNTGRGALIDAPAAVRGLKEGQIGSLGIDVYEEEEGVFFEDLVGQRPGGRNNARPAVPTFRMLFLSPATRRS